MAPKPDQIDSAAPVKVTYEQRIAVWEKHLKTKPLPPTGELIDMCCQELGCTKAEFF